MNSLMHRAHTDIGALALFFFKADATWATATVKVGAATAVAAAMAMVMAETRGMASKWVILVGLVKGV